jgi:hypothetical protein
MFMHEERTFEEIKNYYYVHKLEKLMHESHYNDSDLFEEFNAPANPRL